MIGYARLALFVLLALLVPRICLAQFSVVIAVPHPNTPEYYAFEHRLRSELVAAGFQPASVEVPTELNREGMRAVASRLMSDAAISISLHDGVVTGVVWVHGRENHGEIWRNVPDYPLNEQAPSVFAVRATDVLHGGFLELGYLGSLRPPPPPDQPDHASLDVAAKTPSTALTEAKPVGASDPKLNSSSRPRVERASKVRGGKSPKYWQLSSVGRVSAHFLDYPTGIGISLAALRRLDSQWALGIAGTYFPQSSFRVEPDVGEVRVSRAYLGARIQRQQPLSKQLTIFEQIETGLHTTFVSSNAPLPYLSRSARSYTGYTEVSLGSSWALSGSVAVAGSLNLLVPWKRADVLVLRQVVAEAASPALIVDVGIHINF